MGRRSARVDVNYGSSAPFTLGVEEELQLVSAESYELASRYAEVFGEAAREDDRIRPELLQSTVEVATEPAATVAGGRAPGGGVGRGGAGAGRDRGGRRRRGGGAASARARGGRGTRRRRHLGGNASVLALRASGRHRESALRGARRCAALGGRAPAHLRPPRARRARVGAA